MGADAVKGDYRAAEDGLGVVVHSSPIEIYESLDCALGAGVKHGAPGGSMPEWGREAQGGRPIDRWSRGSLAHGGGHVGGGSPC